MEAEVLKQLYGFLYEQIVEARNAPDTAYRKGYLDALREVMQWLVEEYDIEEVDE